MLFNSLEFLVFFPIVFCLYWFVFQKNLKVQNLLLLISSYVFYGWWDWRFLSLIFLSTIVDYLAGLNIHNSSNKKTRKSYLWISVLFNLGLLGFFKYFNFFVDSWIDLLGTFGYKYQSTWTLKVILPVGISFYTFQTMSYSLDIYHEKLKPTKDFISFASFVSFFPQLVAGPIERASNLLPQILNKRVFNYEQGVQGLRLILWGMFKKVVIADSLAWRVDFVFNNYQNLDGGILILGLIYFSIQIYCDFSGYSDIAIGTSKLFGFEVMSNFKFPYFSRNMGEFWKRWHISLSSWFRDYLYIPLGGSKVGTFLSIRNIFLIFILSGLWHGANLKFIMWGLIHAILYVPLFLKNHHNKYRMKIVAEDQKFPKLKELFLIGKTFIITTITWTFFRSENINSAFEYIFRIVAEIKFPESNLSGVLLILILFSMDWSFRVSEREVLNVKYFVLRYLAYLIISLSIILNFFNKNREFIYFQF